MTKKKHHSSGGFKIPLGPIMGLVAGMYPAIDAAIAGRWTGDESVFQHMAVRYTGWDPVRNKWDYNALLLGYGPLLVGLLAHKFIGGTLGLNKLLGRLKIPFIRI